MAALQDWGHAEPPFHAGEREVQRRAGSFERMAEIGPRVIRSAMPLQHRAFFPLLPFVVLGAPDAEGQPWATLLAGPEPGFVSSPDATHLRLQALPPEGDPLRPLIRDGQALGVLGIELPTRRRNRANGRVVGRDDRGFDVEVLQSFGNCPKYIQRRAPIGTGAVAAPAAVRHDDRLDGRTAAQVARADIFFIATHVPGAAPSAGSDVSHRGGLPGFVRVADDGRSLVWPDFAGNRFFNTFGNLALQPRAGLVFPGFDDGSLLHLAGRAEVLWDGPAPAGFPQAERWVRLQVDEVLYRPAALPLRWRLLEAAPDLEAR